MSEPAALGPLEPPHESPGERGPSEPHEGPLDWARAFFLGLRDTAKEMLDEGRRGAREAQAEGWRRFDAKTKHRRK